MMVKPDRTPATQKSTTQAPVSHPSLQIQCQVGGKPMTYNLEEEVAIRAEALNDCLIEQPSKFAFVAMLHAGYRAASEGAKAQLNQLEARVYADLRAKLAGSGEKVTEKALEMLMVQDSRIQAAQDDLLQLRGVEGRLSVCVEAFRQRKDMLITYASNYRAEMDVELTGLKAKAAGMRRD